MRARKPPETDAPRAVSNRPRRAPAPQERQRDADRSRAQLLAAALDEFAARGFAGARVHEIAAKAGLNKQLITYYFGGKEGLYHALSERWLQQEATLVHPESTLEDLLVAYLQACFDDPRMTRLLLWTGLTSGAAPHERPPSDPNEREDLSDIERRQAQGEIAADLDPGVFQLAMMGAIVAPIAMPQVVRRITGHSPDDPKFQAHYGEQLRRIVRHLAGNPTA